MKPISISWETLCKNAGFFHLEMSKFTLLKSFYDRVESDFFHECVSLTFQELPWEEIRKRLTEAEIRQLLLLCIVGNYSHLEQCYREKGYPELMKTEIANDLKVWLDTLYRDYDGYGLPQRIFAWERDCLNGRVKSFGRLQGNDIHFFAPELSIYRTQSEKLEMRPAFQKGNSPNPALTQGDATINIHIPAGRPLDEKECIRSLQRMCEFSKKFHPDYNFKAIVCYSWLLDTQFLELLSPESNLVKFQKLGHNLTLPGADQTREVRWRIWGEKLLNLSPEELPRRNSMERGVSDFLTQGGQFHEGLLVIFRDELQDLFLKM